MTEAEAHAVVPPQDQAQGSGAGEGQQKNGEAETLYCICRRPEAGFMVFCDGCEDWFHGDCVGLKKRQADKLQKYMCPKCAPPTPIKPAQQSPDAETSKSRSGRSIKKKKWDEEEFEYDFKNKEDDDEDYEEDDDEDERPRKVTPKKATSHPPQYHHQAHQPHQHQHHQQQPQHHHHQPQQQQQMYYSPNNHYTHSNHLNLHPSTHPIQSSYNLNPTLQAINSINSYTLNPTHHMQQPHYSTQLPHSLPIPQQTMGQIPMSAMQGPSPGSKRSYAATQLPPQQYQQPPSNAPPKSSPESKQRDGRRESFPSGVKGDKQEKVPQEKETEESASLVIRNSLSQALHGNTAVATAIEAEMSKVFPPKSKEYKEKARSLLFNLRQPKNVSLKERLMSGALSPAKFVAMKSDDFANGELAEWRRNRELEALNSVLMRPEDNEVARKLQDMVQSELAAEKLKKEAAGANGSTVKEENARQFRSREGPDVDDAEEENSLKKEKESVDIDIDINLVENANLSTPLALPLPLPLPNSGSSSLPPALSNSGVSSVPIWKGDLDQFGAGVDAFNVRAYHVGGPRVDTLLSKVTSIAPKGKLEIGKLSDHLTDKIDTSPHRTRSLIMFEPSSSSDDQAYESAWDYCHNNRSPAVICDTNPPSYVGEEGAHSPQPRIDQLYIVPLESPDAIPEFAFPPNMAHAARKMSLRQAGQRPNSRTGYFIAIIVTRLPKTSPSSASPPSPSSPSSPSQSSLLPSHYNSSQNPPQPRFAQNPQYAQQQYHNLPQMYNTNMFPQNANQQFFQQGFQQLYQNQNPNPWNGAGYYTNSNPTDWNPRQ